ncbi:hypothetical protein CC78DRAFT_120630 [Lojkania enalia]|uniref:Uncharacterized protein n=1 Tax=Lojkania enalia TaxID=147567 RepID=A0A9P4KI09_9PLEO|nr:hypothetical protein CC78DRAFT_120630 [Didymosphaeria enalia]
MMKLTVAFLAALAAADASHGRRHQARQYGYGDNTPVYPPMNSTSAVESSTVLPEEASSSSSAGGYEGYPTYEGTGVPTGPATGASSVPSSTAEAEAETAFSSTGTGVYPTGTGYPTGEELVTSTIYSTQIITKTVSSSVILETTVVPVGTTICSKGEIPESTGLPVVSSGASEVVIASKTPVSEITHTMTQTIVYTIGVSSSAHAQTQLIPTTSTETIYSTARVRAVLVQSLSPSLPRRPSLLLLVMKPQRAALSRVRILLPPLSTTPTAALQFQPHPTQSATALSSAQLVAPLAS